MYTIHIIQDFYIINIIEFDSKDTLTSLFVSVIRAQFMQLVQLYFVDTIVDVFIILAITCIIIFTYFYILSYCRISSTSCCTVSLTSWFIKKILAIIVSCLIYFKILPTSYLVPKFSITSHCCEQCPGTLIIQVIFYMSLR